MSVRAVLVDGMVVLDDSVSGERTIIAGASPGPQVDLSTLGNGVLQQTVSGGVATLSVTTVPNAAAKFIVQQPDGSLPNAQALSALTTGLVKNTTTTGVLSIAVDGVDYVAPADLKYQTVQIGGSSEPQQQRLNFISGATATNNPGNNSTDINISGASIYADGIVTGVIELASVSAALLQVGSLAYVASVDDYFSLQLSALTPDDLTVVTASGRAGYQWVRLYVPSLQWAAATAWWVDPVSGNDEAVGTSSLSPLKTYAELSRRLTGRAAKTAFTVNMVSDALDTDLLAVNLPGSANGASVSVIGVETQIASGTVSTFVAPSYLGGNTLNQVTVIGFNWAPYVGLTVRKHGAAGGAGVYSAVLADLGSGTAVLAPTSLNGSPSSASYFQGGDVIEVVGFTKAPQIQLSGVYIVSVSIAALFRSSGPWNLVIHGETTEAFWSLCSLGIGSSGTFSTGFRGKDLFGQMLTVSNGLSTTRNMTLTNVAFTGFVSCSFGLDGGSTMTLADSVVYPTSPSTTAPLVSFGPNSSVSLLSRTSPAIGVGIFNLAAGSVGIAVGYNSMLYVDGVFGGNNSAASWILAYPSGTRVSRGRGLASNYYESSSAGVKVDWVGNANLNAGSTLPAAFAGFGVEVLDRYQAGRGPSVASASRLVPQGLLSYREWTVTGTATINTFTVFPETNEVTLLNDGLLVELDIRDGLTITHNATPTPFVDTAILLAGGVNAVLPAGSHITLRFNASYGTGTGVWTEVSRDSSTALSVLGNPTAAPALTQPIASTGANLFLGSNAANTGLAFVPVGPLGTTGLVATWPIANARWYAVDGVNGNDANVGFSDVSEALAGAVAKQTIAGLGAIVPRLLDGRRVEIVIANGGVNTALAYTDPLDVLISGITGGQISIKATGTNANAGSTAFAGTSASDLYAGAITVTGLNSAGYNPVGTPTTTVIQCAKNGGGSPAFPAEPAAPLQWRIRFDIATATVALRGICKTITKVAGTDTLTINSALSVAPAAGDVFYVEQAGVQLTGAFNSVGSSGANMNFIGLDITGALQIIGSTFFQFMLCRLGSYQPGVGVSVNANRIIESYGRDANVAAGGGLIIVGQTTGPQNSYNILMQQGLVQTTQLQLISSVNSNVGDGAVLALGVYIDGGVFASDTTDQIFGGVSIAMRVLGSGTSAGLAAGVGIAGARIAFGLIDVEGVGAHPAIALRGTCDVNFAKLVSGSTGNTDVGLDLTLSKGSRVVLTVTPTVTGTGGDVRLSDGTIITWAQAATGIQDAQGNRIVGATAFPIQRLPTGTYLTDLSAGGFATAMTGTGLLVPRALTNTDGTVTITNGNGVAGNPIINTTGLVPAARTVQGTAPVAIAGDHAAHDLSTNRVWSLDANGVTYSFIQQVGAVSLLGNPTGSAANVSEITLGANLVFVGSVLNTTGLTPTTRTVQGTAPISIAGDHAAHDLSANRVWSLDANGVTYSFIQQVSASKLLGNPAGSPANVSEIGVTAPLFFSGSNLILDYDASSLVLSGGTVLVRAALTGDVAASVGLNTTTIQPNVVSYAKIQQASAHTLIGNPTGSLANVEEITLGAGLSFSGTTIVATGTGGITQLTGDVTAGPGSGSLVATLVNIPNDTTMAGDILTAQSAAPATPAANHGRIWFDSTAKNYFAVNESGSKFHMVESLAPAPSQFLTGIADTGTWDAAQPAFTDITGTVAPAQLGSFTNGSVLFWSGGLAQDNANFFWDVADHRLAIGHSSANYPLDVASSAPTSQVHFSDGGGDIGGYLLSTTADQGILSGGTAFNGTNWIAKATSAAILSSSGGSISLTGDTGLTVGAPFSPTSRIVVSGATGVVSLSSLSGGGLVKSATSTGALSNAVSGVDYQPAGNYITALTGAVSATGPGSAVATLSSTGVAPGTYVTPTFIVGSDGRITSASFTNTYQTIESDGTPVAAEAALNFIAPLHAADSGGSPFRTNATLLYDSSASFFLNGSSQLQLKNVGPGAGTIGGGDQYVNQISLDAQGRVTGATAASVPVNASYKFSMNASSSAGIANDQQTVVVPGDSGPVPTGAGFYTASAGTSVTTTLAANYATNGGPVAYGATRAYSGVAFQVYQNFIQMAVANGTTLVYALYKTSSPLIGGSYTALAFWDTGAMNIGTSSGVTSGVLTAGVSIAAGDLLMMAVFRTDSTIAVLSLLQFTATLDLIV